MKIFVACSKHFYDRIPEIEKVLVGAGHEVFMPNSFEEPFMEEKMRSLGSDEHQKWKGMMLARDKENIEPVDAVLILNFEKNGFPNYIGGATFLEMYKAWELGKKLFLFNPIPENLLRDEILGFDPILINGNLSLVV
jgi:hypothetical protein